MMAHHKAAKNKCQVDLTSIMTIEEVLRENLYGVHHECDGDEPVIVCMICHGDHNRDDERDICGYVCVSIGDT